jgi:pilin isopeptide linkage protein
VAEYDGYNIANTYSPYGTLEIEKSVENGTEQGADQDFTFTLTLTELDGTTYRTGDYQYVTSDGREGIIANGGTLTLKAGQSAQVLNVDSETLYSWSESNESGYTLTNTENAEGTLQAGAVQTAKFTNTYKTRGTAYVKVAKEVENHAVTAGKFSFVLKDENGEIVQKASARADGSITFPAIFYSNEDNGKTFDYTVEEVQGELPGYTYDTSVIRIQVTPVDNGDGTMTCTVSYPDSEDGEMPAFKNIYNAKGSAVITAWKQLTGRDLENEEFTFELLKRKDVQAADEDDSESDEEDELLKDYEVIATAKNDINGNINFEALNFTEQDVNKTYEYIVREVAGDDDTVQYSDQTFSYTLTISDNDDGTLSIQQERGQEDLPVFVNKLKSGSVSVTKRIDGETDPTKEFTFRIKITSPAGSELGDSIKFERKQVTDEDDEDEGESKDSEATE